ncbi:MAG TPA: molybdopterin-dependent oxidoreductase, partial [Vicinamibacterales bacterium]|nr:molybdopterin-dependent oxidoreductase [Vicinamibacterales bacterium]
MPGLGTSFGRGGATTAQQDLQNADAILIMGSSMAENHPIGFRFVMMARERGAKIVHVDPRFTRTSAMADLWVPLRAGTDLAFLGGLINYVLQHDRIFRDYVVPYTNAATIVHDDYRDTEDLDGLFSGWDPAKQKYVTDSWLYKDRQAGGQASAESASAAHGLWGKNKGGQPTELLGAPRDETLQDPRCVYQILKRHFARYTPAFVQRVCGTPADEFLRVADTYVSASGPDKTAAICYAVGWTQHSTGVQIIRAAAILQQLLGNMGRPGGGIMALRGHASIQGSTDIPTLYDIMPGYLPMPNFESGTHTLKDYLAQNGTRTGWWHNVDKYTVSLLKAWYGDAATKGNDYGYNWLPRISGDHSHQGYWLDMKDGKMEGLFVMGQNPAVGAPNARLERKALAELQWLVVRDLVETETASFWYDSPEVDRGELRPEEIGTEVFLMPAAGHAEKEGSFTNTQRLLQWHEKAVDPPGDARSETWFMYHLGRRLKEKAAHDDRPRNAGLRALTWTYRVQGAIGEPVVEEVLQEINGRTVRDGALLDGYLALKADGSTACGCWIYSGVFPAPDQNRAHDRASRDQLGHGWGYAWPSDRRIMYNRASARPDGKPWSERKKLVWWDGRARKWTGNDVPDFTANKRPDYRPPDGAEGDAALAGDRPFIMHADGVSWIWVPTGLRDGPIPTYYEPLESPFRNRLYPSHESNPPAHRLERPDNPYAATGDHRFPHVLTTYRLTEHHTAGGMSRYLSHLAELQPEMFAEISPQLAADLRVTTGDWVTIASPRGVIEARALVTSRIPPLQVDGRTVHQVGL